VKKNLVLAILALVGGLIEGELAHGQEAKPAVIHIGSGSSGLGAPQTANTMGIVQDLGLMEKEFAPDGIKVEWSFYKGAGPAQNEAFANNTLDFGFQGDMSAIIAKASGIGVQVLSASGVRGNNYIAVRADSTIASFKDLKGRKIATMVGGPTYLFLARLLEANGLTLQDVQILNITGDDAISALISGQVDAVMGKNVLDLSHLAIQDKVKLFYNTKDEPDLWKNISLFTGREAFVKQYPEITERVVKVWVKAAQWGSDEANRQQMFQFWARGGIPVSSEEKEYAGRTAKDISSPLLDGFVHEKIRQDVALCQKIGIIRNNIDVDSWLDDSFQEQAIKELGLAGYWPAYSGVQNEALK
jgi:sulfonate transport system substrate-binding protein